MNPGREVTAIEAGLITQLEEVRAERDRYEDALFRIVRFYEGRSEQRVGGAVAIAREALEASEP